MQPDVSFIIAAFNAEATLARAIGSALAQRGVTVEVIVADDCSRDGSVAVAQSFARDKVRVVALTSNRGPGGARNAALKAARGRWVAVLDSDDTVHPDRLARLVARAEAAGADIAVDNLDIAQEADGARQAMFPPSLLKRGELGLADFIAANRMFEGGFSFGYMKPVFSRAFVQRHDLRYPETLRIGEDYIFLASMLAKGGRCVVEPLPGYAYHIRQGSISRVLERHHVEAMLTADEAFRREHRLDPAARSALEQRTRSLRRAAAFLELVAHLKSGEPVKALGAILRQPVALKHLRMPIAARLKRLVEPLRLSQGRKVA